MEEYELVMGMTGWPAWISMGSDNKEDFLNDVSKVFQMGASGELGFWASQYFMQNRWQPSPRYIGNPKLELIIGSNETSGSHRMVIKTAPSVTVRDQYQIIWIKHMFWYSMGHPLRFNTLGFDCNRHGGTAAILCLNHLQLHSWQLHPVLYAPQVRNKKLE